MALTSPSSTLPSTSTLEIDALLEYYLTLLDTYTTLREQLNALQSSVHLSISRANFSADRGIRYGQDYYDERMQAIKRLRLSEAPDSAVKFAFTDLGNRSATEHAGQETLTNEDLKSDTKTKTGSSEDNHFPSDDVGVENEETKEESKPKCRNPLQMFGILTPQPLRNAQTAALSVVELLPRIVNIDMEMKETEIKIRRARKGLFKAERRAEMLAGGVTVQS